MNRFITIILVMSTISALIISFAWLLPAYVRLQKTRSRVYELQRFLDQKKAECLEKNQNLNDINGHNPKVIEKIVREKYGLCKPGEVIYTYDPERFNP